MLQPYTATSIAGLLKLRRLSALTNCLYRLSQAAVYFSFSKPSRTKLLTTRMAETFSCTEALRLS